VWNLLENQERMDQIVPNIKDIQVLKKDYSTQKVKVDLYTAPLMPMFEYTILLETAKPFRELRFRKIDGDFKELHGAWRIEPYKGNSILTYIMYIDFGFYVPSVLRTLGLKTMLPETLKAIKKEAEK
jgi:ribosome-associated toxin RatA of RatAB toxin-antitoxin module